MSFWNRLKNLWKLSKFEPNTEGKLVNQFLIKEVIQKEYTPHLAQIIKKSSPVEDFMKKANE